MINKLLAFINKLIYTYFRKKEIMAKKQEASNLEISDLELPDDIGNKLPVVELNDLAFSLAKDEKTGRYHVVTIKFDFATKTIGNLEVLPESNDSKTVVFEDYFKKAISYHVWR